VSSANLQGLDRWAVDARRVEKPWGWELIWAETERYAGKLLFVKTGGALSLQFHREKDEAWHVLEGKLQIELGDPGAAVLNTEVVCAGASFRFPPGTVHRARGIEDALIVEVSTPELDDVVRLEDDYGREGTSEP
jgi:mannose-6-phosphate isomerase